MKFPIDLKEYKSLKFDLNGELKDKEQLSKNIEIVRDSIVFFTALANTKGLGGHTGGAYDIVPEALICDGFKDETVPILFDEAGHRVALQYIMAVLNGYMDEEKLFHYREFDQGLYGHPERDDKNGIFFSSGRLGHMWSHVNGVAIANPGKAVVMLGSDGSQQEGDDSEAARFAVAQNLNVKLLIDDNDVTIAGHPSEYLKGYSVDKTLKGHGLAVDSGDGENIEELYERIRSALKRKGPEAIINKRKMGVDIEGIEGTTKGHDVIPVDLAIKYLEKKGYDEAVKILKGSVGTKNTTTYLGSSKETGKNRDSFGKVINSILKKMPDRKEKVLVVDSDLEGSCGLHHIGKEFPEVYVHGGIMERNNFSVAAGFGSTKGKQGIFGTFAAFLEMIVSEITMARLNDANVIAHFSHSGVDDMADNTCHFGINNFFADNGLVGNTRLYYPADEAQLKAIVEKIFDDEGLRFVFTTRSAVPFILKDGKRIFEDYKFTGKDEIVREGKDVFIVSYGEMLYRALDAVERTPGIGLINKPVLNVIDEDMMKRLCGAKAVLLVETQNQKTGLGIRFGTWLLERGFSGKYAHMGTNKLGAGGLSEQIPYQGLGPDDIIKKIKTML